MIRIPRVIAEHVFDLAVLTEDRTPEEQDALERFALAIDNTYGQESHS